MKRPLDYKPKAQADAIVRKLLRTVKTRQGLIALAAQHGLTRNWVYGWLAWAEQSGLVTCVKKGKNPQYVLCAASDWRPPQGVAPYPGWMCPKAVPIAYVGRRVHLIRDEDDSAPQEVEESSDPKAAHNPTQRAKTKTRKAQRCKPSNPPSAPTTTRRRA